MRIYHFRRCNIFKLSASFRSQDLKYLYEHGFRDCYRLRYQDGDDNAYIVARDLNVKKSCVEEWWPPIGFRYLSRRGAGWFLSDDPNDPTRAVKVERYGISKIFYVPAWNTEFRVVPNGSWQMGVDDEVLDGGLNDVQ